MFQCVVAMHALRVTIEDTSYVEPNTEVTLELAAIIMEFIAALLNMVLGYTWLKNLQIQDGDCCCSPQQPSDVVKTPPVIGYPVGGFIKKLGAVENHLKMDIEA